ncbi:M1 family metallopeptidase [Salinispira pacifica]
MKRIAFLLALTALLSAGCLGGRASYETASSVAWDDYRPFAADLIDPTSLTRDEYLRAAPIYHLTLAVSNDISSLDGELDVRWVNRLAQAQTGVDFVLYPNLIPGSMTVTEVRADASVRPVQTANDGTLLQVSLPKPLLPGQETIIRLSFHTAIPTGDQVGFGGFGYSDGLLSLGYEYPVIPEKGRWIDGKPPKWGDLTANPAAFYICDLTYPTGLVLSAPGTELHRSREEGRDHVLIAYGPARDLFLALGKSLQERSASSGDTVIRSFARVEDEAQSEAVIRAAGRSVADFNRRFGTYPYRSLTFVQARLDAFGLEFPGMIVLTPWLYGDPDSREGGVRLGTLLEATVAHETGHQWFYGLVGNNQLEEPWIDESLAQLATWYYYLDNYGQSSADAIFDSFRARWRRIGNADIPIGRPVREYTPREYSAIIYGRGPIFLDALRKTIGDSRFESLLREIVRRYSFRVVSGADIRRLAEGPTDGGDAQRVIELWNEWVTEAAR